MVGLSQLLSQFVTRRPLVQSTRAVAAGYSDKHVFMKACWQFVLCVGLITMQTDVKNVLIKMSIAVEELMTMR